MNNNEIALKLREDTKYQEFFRAALKKFGEKTPADMSDEEKSKFFTYIETNWTEEDSDDNDTIDECGDEDEEEKFRRLIRKEIAAALTEEEIVQEKKNTYHFKNLIRGGMINISLANDKAAKEYGKRLGSKWQLVNIGEAISYLKELQELAERRTCKKK